MQCGLSPYSIIHLHIRLKGGMPKYLDIPAEFDPDDISTYDNGLSFFNSAPILINADTSVILDQLCPLSHGISVMWLTQ